MALKTRQEELREWLEETVFSREIWQEYHDEWESQQDLVERAGQWFYMTAYSFSQLGRNWGRSLKPNGNPAGKIQNRLVDFPELSRRLRNVVIENQDWREIFRDYDSPGTVFYVDPPYIQTPPGTYKHNMSLDDHRELIATIKSLKGCAYVSGYHHPIYDGEQWTKVYEWQIRNRMNPMVAGDGNNKTEMDLGRGLNTEVLWVWNPSQK